MLSRLARLLHNGEEDITLSLIKTINLDYPLVNIEASLNEKEETALHLAVKYGRKLVVKLLIEINVELNRKNIEGLTPLNLSLTREVDNPEIACLLIKAGANFRIACNKGYSPIDRAIISFYPTSSDSYSAVLDSILETGWNINSIDKHGYTALTIAVTNNNLYSTKYLLDHGANPHRSIDKLHVAPELRSSAYGYAKRLGSNEMIELLEKNGAMNLPNSSLVHQYVRENKIEEIKQIIIQGDYDLNKTDGSGLTPLNLALKTGIKNEKMASILLKAGADPNIPDTLGTTPLIRAAAHGFHDVVKLLIEKGAIINAQDNFGNAPLQTAARNKDCAPKTFSLLIQHGANLNLQNKEKNTALHYAAMLDRDDVVKILMSHGANARLINKNFYTPAELAIYYKNFSIAALIKSFNKSTQEYKEDQTLTLSNTNKYLKHTLEKHKAKIPSLTPTIDLDSTAGDKQCSFQETLDTKNLELKTTHDLQPPLTDDVKPSELIGDTSETK
ncbi:hypothetical protein phytr_7150 [Candidatus Phycorickettsia trachydisci]|uniref:Uncharacterized protein n=1 Tax=Candidatus Phycorickettsia trachydisci TaxID=2115978 RepID=A0A2P1P8T5_9RICK|nr:ankyrin repeat domain-containing protein [Candidatus Phycorickettsia trachydisci]AVP87655.1 hypothetical protein phytr_7150 [Candidatus Phycorickettsia trachydisci]